MNTRFQHKPSRMSTWTAPYQPTLINGCDGLYPVRNQIDFILVNRKYLQFVTNARSYNNINTITDHNLIDIITNMNLELPKKEKKKESFQSPDQH